MDAHCVSCQYMRVKHYVRANSLMRMHKCACAGQGYVTQRASPAGLCDAKTKSIEPGHEPTAWEKGFRGFVAPRPRPTLLRIFKIFNEIQVFSDTVTP